MQIVAQNQPLLTVSGSGGYDLTDASADAQVALQAPLAGLASAFPSSGLNVTSGTIELKGRVTQKQGTQTVTGQLVVADFTGQAGQNQFHNFGSTMDLDVSRTPVRIQITRLNGALTQSGNPGGNFDLTGTYDLEASRRN